MLVINLIKNKKRSQSNVSDKCTNRSYLNFTIIVISRLAKHIYLR